MLSKALSYAPSASVRTSILRSSLACRAPVAARTYATDSLDTPDQSNQPSTRRNSGSKRKDDFYHPQRSTTIATSRPPVHLLTLADLSTAQIENILKLSLAIKYLRKEIGPLASREVMTGMTVAMIFNKRSTRTRVATESATKMLGGHPMFLGSGDIQLGVNETLEDSMKVISSMTEAIVARVGKHEEIETIAKNSVVPVINALSDLYHPTQILADLLTLWETYDSPDIKSLIEALGEDAPKQRQSKTLHALAPLEVSKSLRGKKAAWVGDTNNITNELLVTLPRFGMDFAVASPKGYDKVDEAVWKRVVEAGTENKVTLTNDPAIALKDADVIITDTWISMGQEEEKSARLQAFKGYQLTNKMIRSAGAKPDWKFMHCLPRKQEEVDDEVFYGPRSLVFPEAENRKWTIAALLQQMVNERQW